MTIKFLGAAETVTGSSFLVDTGKTRFLVDCGMFQGPDVEDRNYLPLEFDARELEFVILTHTHLDHCGLIPKLTRNGFRGKIYMTPPTAALAEIILLDSAKIQEQSKPGNRIYESQDAQNAIANFASILFEETIKPSEDVSITLIPAGHILGAASVVIETNEKRIVFSGDIGRVEQSIVKDAYVPESIKNKEVDYVVMESLYGGVEHPEHSESIKKLIDEINATLDSDGNVIIPCFAVHRSQEILEILKYAFENNHISQDVQVYLDSPLAIAATKIYTYHSEHFNDKYKILGEEVRYTTGSGNKAYSEGDSGKILQQNRFQFDNLQFIRHHRQSLGLNKRKRSIIIAGSGMAAGGRVMHHLAANLEDPKAGVIFVGYQAEGTLGRELVEGETQVVINKKQLNVKAKITLISGFSAHADDSDLHDWLNQFTMAEKSKVFLVHAELERSQALAREFTESGFEPQIPEWNETITL